MKRGYTLPEEVETADITWQCSCSNCSSTWTDEAKSVPVGTTMRDKTYNACSDCYDVVAGTFNE